MGIEDEIKTAEAKVIVQFLATDEHYGKKFTPYFIANALEAEHIKLYSRKIEKILSMLTIRFPAIFSFERLSNASYFWIATDRAHFDAWFAEWFG